jgi:hypothetical protein
MVAGGARESIRRSAGQNTPTSFSAKEIKSALLSRQALLRFDQKTND